MPLLPALQMSLKDRRVTHPGHLAPQSACDCEAPIKENVMVLVGWSLSRPGLQKNAALFLIVTCFLTQNKPNQNKRSLPFLPLRPASSSLPQLWPALVLAPRRSGA